MRAIIIEDEKTTSQYLRSIIEKEFPEVEVLAEIDSVESGIKWFETNEDPELIFSDVRLTDGLSFDIFDKAKPVSAIAFVTAYDEYVMKSFEYSSIYYILKPFTKKDIGNAIQKTSGLFRWKAEFDWKKMMEMGFRKEEKEWIGTVLVESGGVLYPVSVDSIIAIESVRKESLIYLKDGRQLRCGTNLKDFEDKLDPKDFSRISRQWIIRILEIESIQKSTFGKLKVNLKAEHGLAPIDVSKDSAPKVMALFGR